MRRITLDEFLAELKAQGVGTADLAFRCPICGTIQSANDLIAAGAGIDFLSVEKYLAFSCIGRWTKAGPVPNPRPDGYDRGCNWTLGGLLQLHELTVITPDGTECKRFEPCTPEEAKAHAAQRQAAAAS